MASSQVEGPASGGIALDVDESGSVEAMLPVNVSMSVGAVSELDPPASGGTAPILNSSATGTRRGDDGKACVTAASAWAVYPSGR